MAERIKKRRFNEISKQLEAEKIRLEELMPDNSMPEGVWMPYKLRIAMMKFGLEVLSAVYGKKDEISVKIPHGETLRFKVEGKK